MSMKSRLAPFIQEYIYQQGWADLRPIQAEACRVVFDTEDHLLVAAGTAAGKTEAAFLPVLTRLYERPSASIGALYIGPIKALINDQFERLNDLLQFADIPVHMWHGDVTQSKKAQVLRHPQGILQITPESLESLLVNKASDLQRLLGELQFVVIDEVHAFIGSDRGDQILCQLTRLAQLTRNEARRIGLSATLGDYDLAERWMAAGTQRRVVTPKMAGADRKIQLSLEHFYDPGLVVRAKEDTRDQAFNPYHLHLLNQSLGKKCLIFANGRTATEEAIAGIRSIAQAKGYPDIYHVHHGSISADLRQVAEAAMREPDRPAVTAATVTFEMGIDLGQLDRVIQLESPSSVASFLQRLGRSGRRGGVAEMRFVCAEEKPTGEETLPEQLPWQLLQAIAIIQLYLEEQWIEPPQFVQYPYSLLYHQTMSTLASLGELTPAILAQQVLPLPPFQKITQADYRDLLRHWIELEHIEVTETKTLIIGLKGEKIARNFKFYAIFADNEEYIIKCNQKIVGSIMVPPSEGDRISLAGQVWEVLQVDSQRKAIKVRPTQQAANASSWRGTTGDIHTRVLQRMRQVLQEDTVYPYLHPSAQARLQTARQFARSHGILNSPIVLLEEGYACIFPWIGTKAFRTLERFLRLYCRPLLNIKGVKGRSPYFLVVNLGKCPIENLRYEIQALGERPLSAEELMEAEEAPKIQKYDAYIPDEFLRKAFAADGLAIEDLKSAIAHGFPALA
ncbi:DEAD/DEAH box helicase [Alkalinema sp. FACHB-956]|uniref:DEAD/DEAH box helicase n=1 Tax=Alkalinema sp. FACHB-956 TaxID=2692768 RepID=UPI00168A2164|nr:DEAD/DEAH box helicase [Alkalinema sp. FACHB-956]